MLLYQFIFIWFNNNNTTTNKTSEAVSILHAFVDITQHFSPKDIINQRWNLDNFGFGITDSPQIQNFERKERSLYETIAFDSRR